MVFIACLVTATVLDTVLWYHTEHRLEATVRTALGAVQKNGWAVTPAQLKRGGWPFGAWVELNGLTATHPASTTAPYDAGWAGEHLRLGGTWVTFIRSGWPLALTGHQAVRLVMEGRILTALGSDIQFRFPTATHLTLLAPQLELSFSGTLPERHLSIHRLKASLIHLPSAAPEATRLGLQASAVSVSDFPLPYGLSGNLREAHIAVALTASHTAANLSLLAPSSYDRLLLQDASAATSQAPESRITLTGTLDLPEQNGTLTVNVIRWHDLASTLLSRPETLSWLAPDLQASLQKALQKTRSSSDGMEQPVSISVPVQRGQVLPDVQALLPLITRGFSDSQAWVKPQSPH